MQAGLSAGLAGLGGPEAMTVGRLMQGLLGGLPQEQIPGVSYGMIPTMENLPEFRANYLKNLENLRSGAKLDPQIPSRALGEAYMATRYPQRYGAVPAVEYTKELPPGVGGEFTPPGFWTGWKPRILMSKDYPGYEVGTLGHESQHALQHQRTPKMFENYPKENLQASGELTPEYQVHPTEVGARKAGETAEKGYRKFLDLIGYVPGQNKMQTIYNWLYQRGK